MKNIMRDFETITEAAEEGYRNAESDAGDGVEGAAASMKRYGDAFASINRIKKTLRAYPKLMAAAEKVIEKWGQVAHLPHGAIADLRDVIEIIKKGA